MDECMIIIMSLAVHYKQYPTVYPINAHEPLINRGTAGHFSGPIVFFNRHCAHIFVYNLETADFLTYTSNNYEKDALQEMKKP